MTFTFSGQFYKSPVCPSSESLLAYQDATLSAQLLQRVERHLAACDFCNAELQLLTRHQANPEEYFFAEMPAQLRMWAERLLQHGVAPQAANATTREAFNL